MTISDILTVEQGKYYRDNPVEFLRDMVLSDRGVELTELQVEIITSVWNDLIYTKKSNELGKTMSLALVAIAFIVLYPDAKVIMGGISEATVKCTIMPEVRKWVVGSKLEDLFELTPTVAHLKSDNSYQNFIQGRVAKDSEYEAFQGIMGDNLMMLVDDYTCIQNGHIKAMVGNLSSSEECNHHLGMVCRDFEGGGK